jgi:putative holliday junction resolvase
MAATSAKNQTSLNKTSLNQSHLPIVARQYPDITGTVMAFDFGEKRIGVATGETLLKTAHALTTISAEQNDIKFKQIALLIAEWQPSLLVVGLPMHIDGDVDNQPHLMMQLAKKFAQRLEGRFNLPVVMVDERLSSLEASQSLNAAGIRGIKQKTMLDAVAAQSILQSYFDGLMSNSTHATS